MATVDGILSSQFGRKAVETGMVSRNGRPCAANLLRELLEGIDRLAQHCQLSEFTEHGLPHLASLVDRIQTWTRSDGTPLLDAMTSDEAFLLLFAVLSHDIGMLTQREDDLKNDDRLRYARAFADLPMWIRRTHVPRLEQVLRRLLEAQYPEFFGSSLFGLAASLARSHQYWPTEEGYRELKRLAPKAGFDPERVKAMAGVLAVADLLDEDSARCDSMTLFANKAGTLMNRAHWLRHMLVANYLEVKHGEVCVRIQVPSNLEGRVCAAVEGLRNHLRLAQAYNAVLDPLQARISLSFPDPAKGDRVPEDTALALLLCEPDVHLMRTLPEQALPAANEREPAGSDVEVMGAMLKRVDRAVFDHALGPVGQESGRSDLEITYAAASSRGEGQRRRALELLRDAAVEAHARGDVAIVRRLASLVLGDLGSHGGLPLTDNTFWAAAYTLHWACHWHELRSFESLLTGQKQDGARSMDQSTATILEKLPLKWQVLAVTTRVLLRPGSISWPELVALIERRVEFFDAPLSPEEQIAWHDLLEALWAVSLLREDPPAEFAAGFARLRELERDHRPPSQLLLAELAWRMAVQSHCLNGYGRWQARCVSMNRADYGLLPDPGREAMARVWTTWFHGRGNDLKQVAREARKANPPGSELYVAALEAEWLASNIDVEARVADDDALHRRQEFRDATERDGAYRLVNSTITSLLDVYVEPKKERAVYLGGRGAELPRYEAVLGERVSLRRWYLGSWHKVVGYNVRTVLSMAYTMHLEGDKVIGPVLDVIRDLPWGIPYVGIMQEESLKHLLPRVEPNITPEHLAPMLEAIAGSPRRIANIRHPGLRILGDALTPEMLPDLVRWTIRELQDPTEPLWPATFEVWSDLMEHVDLPPKSWQELSPLLDHALGRIHMGDVNERIIRAAIARAPWPVTGPLVRRIADVLVQANTDPHWAKNAKDSVVCGLLQRPRKDWQETKEGEILIGTLEHLASRSSDSDAQILLESLRETAPAEGHDHLAEWWLERLEAVRDSAVARKSMERLSFGETSGYRVGPNRNISDRMALRAAQALDELWAAENATTEEIRIGTGAAGHLFRASAGLGRSALARSLLSAMASRRTAIGLVDREPCAPSAWYYAAHHSAHFPADCLPELSHLLVSRLVELPPEASHAQARFAAELLLRSEAQETRQLAQTALIAIRARTAGRPAPGAWAYVASTGRMLEQDGWPPTAASVLPLLVEWAKDAALVPDPRAREAVAGVCVRLAERVEPPLAEKLEGTLERLRNDVRTRVRRAAKGREQGSA